MALGSGVFLTYEVTVQFHLASSIVFSFFNAFSFYHPTATPIWPVPGVTKRPAVEFTTINRNKAIISAMVGTFKAILPPEYWLEPATGYLAFLGMDVGDISTDPSTPVGVGNLVAAETIKRHFNSAWNAKVSSGTERVVLCRKKTNKN